MTVIRGFQLTLKQNTIFSVTKESTNGDLVTPTPWPLAPPLYPFWRHQMETFSELLLLCGGNPPVTGGFPSQKDSYPAVDISLLSVWTNCSTNTRWTSNSRRHEGHLTSPLCISNNDVQTHARTNLHTTCDTRPRTPTHKAYRLSIDLSRDQDVTIVGRRGIQQGEHLKPWPVYDVRKA